jgi:hypothetical protein
MASVTIDSFDFVLSEGSQCIYVFKGDALADTHCCNSREEAEAIFEKVKASKHVITECNNSNKIKGETE